MLQQNDKTSNTPMPVTKAYCFHLQEEMAIYAACPRCSHMILREYVHHCCNCGQALSWDEFDLNKIEIMELL